MLTTLDIRDGAAWITLDDGKVNAISFDMLREIEARLENSTGPIKGRKGIFSAGFALKTFARGAEASRQMVKAGVRVIARMLALPRPIVTPLAASAP